MKDLMAVFIGNQTEMNTITILILLVVFVFLSFVTHLQQYTATYGLVYGEVKATRIALAEKLRQLPCLLYTSRKPRLNITKTCI